jgi:hypothetical protein
VGVRRRVPILRPKPCYRIACVFEPDWRRMMQEHTVRSRRLALVMAALLLLVCSFMYLLYRVQQASVVDQLYDDIQSDAGAFASESYVCHLERGVMERSARACPREEGEVGGSRGK